MRRKLAECYEDEGADDPVRVHSGSGGYAPRFERRDPKDAHPASTGEPPKAPPPRRGELRWWIIAAVAPTLVVLAGVFWARWQMSPAAAPAPDHSARNRLERSVFAKKSTATLQAANLAEQTSGLLFPIADVAHQKPATSIYRDAIRIDPRFKDDFAGAAHSIATLTLLAQTAEIHAKLLSEAGEFAATAIDLAPRNGCSQSAEA